MPPSDIEIPGEDFDEELPASPAEAVTPSYALTDVLGANATTMHAVGRRAAEVLGTGIENVVAQRAEVRATSANVVEFSALAAALGDGEYFSFEVRLALSETEAHPFAAFIPVPDIGRLFMIDVSPEQIADGDFVRTQIEVISAGAKELLDLAGMTLFVDELGGAEATLAAVRLRGMREALATLTDASAGHPAVRVDLTIGLPDGGSAQVVVALPASLLARVASKLAPAAPQPIAPPPVPPRTEAPALRAVRGDAARAAPNVSPIRGPSSAPEVDTPVHPVRFPALAPSAPNAGPQQQLDLIMDVPLRVTVELGRSSMTLDEVLALGPGSVVELNKLAGEPVDIFVNDRPIARGEVVVVDENFGVRVTEILSPRTRVNAMAR